MTYFSLVQDTDGLSLIVTFDNGEINTFSESHANFETVKTHALESLSGSEFDEDFVRDQFDIRLKVGAALTSLSDRVRFDGENTIYFDGDPLDTSLTAHTVRLLKQGVDDYKPFVAFLEKVYTNPSVESRDSLFDWLSGEFQRGRLSITPAGDFIAYKGTQRRADGTPESVVSGEALVNGQLVKGHIPNIVGSVIEMPRSQVDSNSSVGCSTGLHAGTWNYAKDWASDDGFLLIVKINPRDVVSVPQDCNWQKLRVSRYEVVGVVEKELDVPLYRHVDEVDDEDDYDEDYYDEYYDEYYDDDYDDDYEDLF